jgi:multicomponent Na+:H+ antiporter subunit D
MGRWLPPFGISFTADLFGAFLALVGGIAALACGIYGVLDVDRSGRRYGFYPFLFLMMAGVSGSFLTGDIFNLYVWFEVLLIASFGLLILGSERGQIDGATKYAFLNLVATTLFLIATAYLYGIFGTLNMADIALKARAAPDTAPLMTLATLYLLAFGMKAAAFPVNFWLPASYHTPRVVASALFAGVLTKVGVYALTRTLVMLLPAERAELSSVIAVVAVLTMILGALGALAQTDMRRLLGYVVISSIGVMLAGVALSGPAGLAGTVFYISHSIVVMTALYIASGMAARAGGGFSLAALGGLYREHPLFSALSFVLFLSVAGLPPFSGLWAKVVLVKASLDAGAGWLATAILLTGFLITIAMGRVWLLAYWRPAGQAAADLKPARDLPFMTAYLPLLMLAGLSVVVGFFPDEILKLAQLAAQQLLDPSAYIQSVFPAGGAG